MVSWYRTVYQSCHMWGSCSLAWTHGPLEGTHHSCESGLRRPVPRALAQVASRPGHALTARHGCTGRCVRAVCRAQGASCLVCGGCLPPAPSSCFSSSCVPFASPLRKTHEKGHGYRQAEAREDSENPSKRETAPVKSGVPGPCCSARDPGASQNISPREGGRELPHPGMASPPQPSPPTNQRLSLEQAEQA